MRDPLTAPAEAYAPDADRAGPDASAQLPEWLVHLPRPADPLPARAHARRSPAPLLPAASPGGTDRPDLPAGSTQAEAASIRGPFGNAIAWMCRRHGIGPGHKDWPELSRAIVAFGGSLKGFRAGAPACGLQWWENPNVVPGMVRWLRRARHGDRIAAAAAGCCECCAAGAERHAAEAAACHGCLRHGCPRQGGRFLLVPAPVRRPGRQAARDCQLCHA